MRKLATVAAIAALSGGAGTAVAADLGGMPEPMAPPPPILLNWSGFYLGLGVGGAAVSSHAKTIEGYGESYGPILGDAYLSTRDVDLGGMGALGTIQLGYDYQFPASRWVGGLFADFDWASASGEESALTLKNGSLVNAYNIPYSPSGNIKVDFENDWTIGGRLGYLWAPGTLLYALAGYSQGQASVNGNFPIHHTVAGLPSAYSYVPFSDSVTSGGWTAGVGMETHLRDNWFLKLEYRYSQYGGGTVANYNTGLYNADTGVGVAACADTMTCWSDYRKADVDTDVQTARVVLTYKFNHQQLFEPLK
jgi:outer membrane immunogenic protein